MSPRRAQPVPWCSLAIPVCLLLLVYATARSSDRFEARPDGSQRGRHAVPEDDLYKSPLQMLLSGNGQRLFVACEGTDEILVVDTARRAVTERVAVGRERVARFVTWLAEQHPEIEDAKALAPDALIRLANEFEDGAVRENRGLRESWRVGFIDHLYERRSDFEPE